MRSVEELIDIIENRKNRGSGLEHFKTYMKSIGNPESKLKSIHIAGTNGKGSTLNYIRSMLQEANYKVGSFSSPYLETHRDRIRINNEYISEESFLRIATTYYDSWMEYDLSMFEIDMAIACVYFLEEACDFCIFEVGLGGRKDSTNILHPLISVITNIGMDHMEQLGYTYEAIATEKGGIIKEHTPFICGEVKGECIDVFQSLCAAHHSELCFVKEARNIVYSHKDLSFSYRDYSHIHIQNGAHYQVKNAACALEVMHYLKKLKAVEIKDEEVLRALDKAQWLGRFETIHEDPLIIVDGAHNEDGIQALKETLKDFGSVAILFAALKDKNTHTMMELLCDISDQITVTQFPFYRAQDAAVLAEDFPVSIDADYQCAILNAMKHPDTPLIITGSLYFISQVREFMKSIQ